MTLSILAVVLLALSAEVYCETCPLNCVNCTDSNTCTECLDGFYNGHLYDNKNYNLSNDCSLKCNPLRCDACFSYKDCSRCKAGYCNRGNKRSCSSSCAVNCKTCSACNVCTVCVLGYYGTTCNMTCGQGCLDGTCDMLNGSCICDKNFEGIQCDQCIIGKYGPRCQFECPRGCLHNNCDKNGLCLQGCKHGYIDPSCNVCMDGFTGERCDICVNGFYGPNCLRCPTACEECTSATQCSRCSVGFYGQNCSQVCSENCGSRSCSLVNGTCLQCRRGFYGERCEFICPTNCVGNSCSLDGKCFTCKVGYYGESCDKQCSRHCKGSCKRFRGECHSCIDGFFGDYCDENCPDDCINCTSNTECTLCKTGKKGITCQQECSNCTTGTQCRKSDGSCNEACADGFQGTNCDIPCDVRCKTCHRSLHYSCTSCPYGKYGKNGTYLACHLDCRDECLNKSCNEQNGYCLSGCKNGYWGKNCDLTCPERCKNRLCSMQSGSCLEGCIEGFFGDNCTNTCSTFDQHCIVCDLKANGQYEGCRICDAGYFPSYELKNRCIPCPLHCNENNCSSETGFCLHGCKKGHWGDTCNALCASTCKMCYQQNGKCLTCISGKYGDNCLENCSSDCAGRCEKDSGECVIGCARKSRFGSFCDKDCCSNCVNKECNWTTGHCSSECVNGYFGNTCDNSCSKHCKNSSCSKDSGECNYGCIDGYEEPLCVQEATGSVNTGVIIGIVTGVVGLVAVCILVVVLYIRHHRRKKGKRKEDIAAMKSRSDSEDIFDERETDRGDVEIADFDTGLNYALSKKSTKETHLNTSRVQCQQPEMFEACLTKEVSDAEYNTSGSRDYFGVEVYDEIETNFDDETTEMGAVSYEENAYYNAGTVLRRRIELNKLKEFVSKKSRDDFIAEFQELPVGLIKSYEASQKMENRAKNRYRDLYPYDGRRVIIKKGRSDYINASYIDGYMKRNAYIASTGPTVKHMGEDFAIFWEMVWQEHVTKIIMLTKLVELGVWKCDQYWPNKGSCCTYGNVAVTCRKENIQKNFTIRTFDIENLKNKKERRTLYQMHFTSWPDKGIPASVAMFTEFYNIANDESVAKATDYPVLVHCSAGVGRTGTYIALDILTTEGRAEGYVDIFACVRKLREERVNMVQTLEQYEYIHKCLVENLTQSDFKPKQMTKYAGKKK